jgi:hypothetical protein
VNRNEYQKAIRRLEAGIEASNAIGMREQASAWADTLSYASRQGFSHLSATPEVYKRFVERAVDAASFVIRAERKPDSTDSQDFQDLSEHGICDDCGMETGVTTTWNGGECHSSCDKCLRR